MHSQVHQILDSSSDTNDYDISDSDHSFEEVDGNVLNFSWEISSSCSSNEAVLTDEQLEDSERVMTTLKVNTNRHHLAH